MFVSGARLGRELLVRPSVISAVSFVNCVRTVKLVGWVQLASNCVRLGQLVSGLRSEIGVLAQFKTDNCGSPASGVKLVTPVLSKSSVRRCVSVASVEILGNG